MKTLGKLKLNEFRKAELETSTSGATVIYFQII